MLSYRHIYHAGNHADVLKHVVLLWVLHYFCQKNKGFTYIDTHAGIGRYDLHQHEAQLRQEYLQGVGALISTPLPEPLKAWQSTVKACFEQGFYHGSAALAATILRPQDEMFLYERHPQDSQHLEANIRRIDYACRCHRYQQDGFAGLIARLPTPTRRLVALIDPSYETDGDYEDVISTLKAALKRMATGCYMLWYPLLAHKNNAETMIETLLSDIPDLRYIDARLDVAPAKQDGFGMTGSGMLIINPPYLLQEKLQQALPILCQHLAQKNNAAQSLRAHLP